jgi:hypothetical protein
VGELESPQVPMVVDTGADACFVDHHLAYTVGVNPTAGGAMGTVQDLSSESPTALYPVELYLPQFDLGFPVDVYFTTLQNSGWNGLLGHKGFLERFTRVTFYPGDRFELELP